MFISVLPGAMLAMTFHHKIWLFSYYMQACNPFTPTSSFPSTFHHKIMSILVVTCKHINLFTPTPTPSFLTWTLPSLHLDISIVANRGFSQNHTRMANSVDPDETARYELSHLDLHCLQNYLYWSVVMKGLRDI